MQDQQNDILKIGLNEEGVGFLMKLFRIMRIVFLLSILVSIPLVVITALEFARPPNTDVFKNLPPLKLQADTERYSRIIYVSVWFLQVFYYWRFSVAMRKAMIKMDDEKFNSAFHHLCMSARFLVATILVSLFVNVLAMIVYIKYPI